MAIDETRLPEEVFAMTIIAQTSENDQKKISTFSISFDSQSSFNAIKSIFSGNAFQLVVDRNE